MKITDIENNIKITDLENFFDIFEDNRKNYVFNLNETVYINSQNTKEYILKTDAYWPLISYKIYGTTRLVWLLLKLNDVQASDIFKKKMASETIKYIEKEYVNNIVNQL